MTTEQRRGRGEKGQHIFENVNLNNVFRVCMEEEKKAIMKCHLVPVVASPLPLLCGPTGAVGVLGLRRGYVLGEWRCLVFLLCIE